MGSRSDWETMINAVSHWILWESHVSRIRASDSDLLFRIRGIRDIPRSKVIIAGGGEARLIYPDDGGQDGARR